MHSHNTKRLLTALMPLLMVALAGGCARQPPGQTGASALSGIQMQVTVQFAATINPSWYYYFLINNPLTSTYPGSNSATGPGPIPVQGPVPGTTYGNGFATSSSTADTSGGFTDFVLYSYSQSIYPSGSPINGFGLYHVNQAGTNGANNPLNFQGNGTPLTYQIISSSKTNDTIEFTFDLAQLFPSSAGYSQSEAINKVQSSAFQWLQVNMVATNVVTTNPTASVAKEYDSFGDDSNGIGSFLTIHVPDFTSYANGGTNVGQASKPGTSDVYPPTNAAAYQSLQIVNWQVQIVNTNN